MIVSLVRHGEKRDWCASMGLQVDRLSTVSKVGMHMRCACYAIGESGHQQALFTRGLPLLALYSNSSLSE